MAKMSKPAKSAKVSKTSTPAKAKAKPEAKAVKAEKLAKASKAKPVKKSVAKPVKAVSKAAAPKDNKGGSRRRMSDAKIAKLQKMYASKKHPVQKLCDEFGISMATLFNYLKVNV